MNWSNHYWVIGGDQSHVWSSASASLVPATDSTFVAWDAAGNFPQRIASLAELRNAFATQYPAGMLSTYAAAKQAAIAVGGVSVNIGGSTAIECSTDPASLVLLQGAATVASANPTQTFNWVPINGTPVTLTATQISTMFAGVTSFIQATFTTLSGVISAINAGTITTRAQVDTPPSPIPAWPANS